MMISVENLIQFSLEESRAREIISFCIEKQSSVYIINSKNDSFQLLTLGQLQQIQNAHPKKILIHLEKFDWYLYQGKVMNLNHEQNINCFDLWFQKDFYNEFLLNTRTCFLDIEPNDPNYAPELDFANIVYRTAISDKKTNLSMKQKVNDLLGKMYPDISDDSKKRITLITNTIAGKKPGRKKKIK